MYINKFELYKIDNLIKENRLLLSNEIIQAIDRIVPYAKIANKLSNVNGNKFNNEIGGILDISDKEGFFKFIPYKNLDKYYKEKYNKDLKLHTYNEKEPLVKKAFQNFNYTDVKIGKIVRKIFKENNIKFSDSDIENLVNFLKSEIHEIKEQKTNFKIVKGEDIRKWYSCSRYADGKGHLNKSCMRHDHKSEFLDMYVKNPRQVSLLILTDENDNLLGRALIWNISNQKYKLMDRPYTANEYLNKKFFKYAMDNNMAYAEAKKMPNFFTPPSYKQSNDILKVKLDNGGKFKYYPYLDVLQLYNWKDGELYSEKLLGELVIELTDKDGSYTCSGCDGKGFYVDDEDNEEYFCDICNYDF